MKKYISYILILAIVLSCFVNFGVCAATQIPSSNQNNSEYIQNTHSYQNYITKFSGLNTIGSIKKELNVTLNKQASLDFTINVANEGLYTVGFKYKPLESKTVNLEFGLKIDGVYPYAEAKEFELPRMWKDVETVSVDSLGNEFSPQQIMLDEMYYNLVVDTTGKNGYEYYIHLSSGEHKITLNAINGGFDIEYVEFSAKQDASTYSEPKDTSKFYDGESIIIEGEDAKFKSSAFLSNKGDSSTAKITPHSTEKTVMNYIGGPNWKNVGDTIIWETPYLKEGYYKLSFSFRQNTVIGGKVYRLVAIDGKVPFEEAEEVGFTYKEGWQLTDFSHNDNDQPYYVYFSEGIHEISMTAVLGDMVEVSKKLQEAVIMLSSMYLDINIITGETVDVNRDYNLFGTVPDMENRLIQIKDLLNDSADTLAKVTGQNSGSNYSVIKNMVVILEQMLKSKFDAHKYKSAYYSKYCAVSSVLQDLNNMPLDVDKIILSSPNKENSIETVGFFENLTFSFKRFLMTFVRDYSSLSNAEQGESISVWVNWGRDQAQVLSRLISTHFTPDTGIAVDLKLVNASVVQAVLSGDAPDCILQHNRSEPVNLAMRGALYDLKQFDDLEEVLTRFQPNADIPYRYKDGLYALPDTQKFFVMFYRKDILESYGLTVPKTWNEFDSIAKILIRNNMSVYLPTTVSTSTVQINAGVGSANIFPTLLLQNGVKLYSDDGKTTNLLSTETMEVFKLWTEYYSKQKFPVSLDFYNRFRTGVTPIGIASYETYSTLKVAAPEIDGLWGLTSIPGTVNADGSVSKKISAGGTACGILSTTSNPKNAWEFLKWWTSDETQYNFSVDVENILGTTGRIESSNIEAVRNLSWDDDALDGIMDAWENVEEIPEYPGSYYVTRSIYQAFWNVVNENKSTKDMLMKYGAEANAEMADKWQQYANRN